MCLTRGCCLPHESHGKADYLLIYLTDHKIGHALVTTPDGELLGTCERQMGGLMPSDSTGEPLFLKQQVRVGYRIGYKIAADYQL